MLNSCPKFESCGTWLPYWTDDPMPQDVGVVSDIQAYGVYKGICDLLTAKVKVMRCSWDTDYDLIYKYVGSYMNLGCTRAFCGMS